MKIETFATKDEALNRINNASSFKAKELFMPADINANDCGMAWVVQNSGGRMLREDGCIW